MSRQNAFASYELSLDRRIANIVYVSTLRPGYEDV